ncbi:MAG: hypothetical protein J6P58_03285 [Oscillospiraceae bacterium]|nr:hypothetical protein [Oscillospiraceae bacterium]
MPMKRRFSAEAAYLLGIVCIAMGVVLMERADFGVSMVVAPAYLLYRWLSPTWSFFTFGTAEYCLQAVLLIVMILVLRRFRLSYLFSFVTAVIYGFVLDGFMLLGAMLPTDSLWLRAVYYVCGMLFCAAGVSAMFHSYISPQAYELFVKEVSAHFHVEIHRFKTGYDCVSCLIGILMSFLIFGLWHFEGVKAGTILCALVNGTVIGRFSAFYEKHFTLHDRFPWRKYFS